jgi:group I intron endonuclease
MRIQSTLGPLKVLNAHLNTYPTPINLSYAYNFGSLAGIVLFSQIITGILLAMHYVGHVDLAFASVVHLMTDVPSGMILRYAHANGASLFFVVVYIHILRGIYYSSGNQPREAVWITGVVILLVMVITAFIGYIYYSQKWIFNDAIILNLIKTACRLKIQFISFLGENSPPVALKLNLRFNFNARARRFVSPPPYSGGLTNLRPSLREGGRQVLHLLSQRQEVHRSPSGSPFALAKGDATCLNLLDGVYKLHLCCIAPLPITLNTKDHIKINITPVKSYYNLHLTETQLKIQKENSKKAGVYLIVNNVNSNFYVGSAITNRINTRFRNHCIHLKSSNKPLLRAIRKYGIQNFSFHIVEYFKGFVHKENLKLNHLKLLELETYYISSLKPIYNILTIAGSSFGYKHTEESINKIKSNYSQVRKDTIGNLNKGKPLSNDTKNKLKSIALNRFADKDFKDEFLLMNKYNLFKGKNVILCSMAGNTLSEYSSIQQVSQVFSCDRKTVRKYLNSGKLFKKLGYLKIKPSTNE